MLLRRGCSPEYSRGAERVPGANGANGSKAAIPVAPASMAASESAIQGYDSLSWRTMGMSRISEMQALTFRVC